MEINSNFEKLYKQTAERVSGMGAIFVFFFFIYYVYLSSKGLLYPLLEEEKLSKITLLFIGVIELALIYSAPYLVEAFFSRLKKVSLDCVDRIVYKSEVMKVNDCITSLHIMSYIYLLFTFVIFIQFPYLEFLPIPLLFLGFQLLESRKKLLQNY